VVSPAVVEHGLRCEHCVSGMIDGSGCDHCEGTGRISKLYGVELRDFDDWSFNDLKPLLEQVQDALSYCRARGWFVRYLRGDMNRLRLSYCNSEGDYTTISLATFYGLDGKARGERVRDLLRSDLREASIGNDVNLAPIGGGFALTITTTYVFTDDDGEPVADNEKRVQVHGLGADRGALPRGCVMASNKKTIAETLEFAKSFIAKAPPLVGIRPHIAHHTGITVN